MNQLADLDWSATARWGQCQKIASAGNRTRINCLEGSYADHYTTDATIQSIQQVRYCLLYTSDAADDLLCVDLGGRRII